MSIEEKVVKTVIKPVTAVVTYRGVPGYAPGLYTGRERDMAVLGGDERETYLTTTISEEAAERTLGEARVKMEELLGRVDEMFVYLGKRGAGAALDYVLEERKKGADIKIAVVACDCDERAKRIFAKTYALPVIWSSCGGERSLKMLVDEMRGGASFDSLVSKYGEKA